MNASQTGRTKRVLVVQTANAILTDRLLDEIIRIHGLPNVTFLRQRNMASYLQERPGLRVMENVNRGRLAFARKLRKEGFDRIISLDSGEPGFWKLKLLPLFCNPWRHTLYDQNGACRPAGAGPMLAAVAGGMLHKDEPARRLRRWRRVLAPILFLWSAVGFGLLRFKRTRRSVSPPQGQGQDRA